MTINCISRAVRIVSIFVVYNGGIFAVEGRLLYSVISEFPEIFAQVIRNVSEKSHKSDIFGRRSTSGNTFLFQW